MGLEALIRNKSTRRAEEAQREGANLAIEEQRRQYDLMRGDLAPRRDAESNALSRLVHEMDRPVTQADIMQDPGYQFGLTEGQKALDRQFSRSGGRVSGASLKAAQRFGTDYASTGYGAAYQRRNDALNRLASVAGVGQSATNIGVQMGGQYSNAISNLLMQRGENTGAARLARGNIWGNAIGDASSAAMRMFGGG
jgi:hypothetical protein